MRNRKIVFAAVAATFAAVLAGNTAPSESAPTTITQSTPYTLSMVISDSGQLIAEPVLRIHTGAKSRVRIAQEPGSSYALDFVFSDAGEGMIAMDATISATSPTLGAVNFEPKLKLRPGEPVRVEYGNEAPGIRPLRIEFMLTE